MTLLAPGALFEFVFLPVWPIAKGFRPTAATAPNAAPVLATVS